MGSPAIFNGDFVKFLKNNLKFSNDRQILNGSADPSATPTNGTAGDLYIGTTGFWRKTDSGTTTNWSPITISNIFTTDVDGLVPGPDSGEAAANSLLNANATWVDPLALPISTSTQSALDTKASLDVFFEDFDGLVPGPSNADVSGLVFLKADHSWADPGILSFNNASTTYTLAYSDSILFVTAAANWVLTLPDPNTMPHKIYTIERTDNDPAHTVTFGGYLTTNTLKYQGECYQLFCDGSVWSIINHTGNPFTGDSGSGGKQGLVPAPASGDAAAGKYLKADGTFAVPPVMGAGQIVQVVNFQTGTYATGAAAFPLDNSIPQQSEGTEFMTLAITPTSATNKLRIQVEMQCGTDAGGLWLIGALFKDAANDALITGLTRAFDVGNSRMVFSYYMTSGGTSATTFKVRGGTDTGATFYFGLSSGTFGGTLISSMTIEEIQV